LCWAAKWLGDEDILFSSVQTGKPLQMLGKIHKLLDQADAVIHFNGKKFDIPTLNREFLLNGMLPPSPYKQIDLLQTARSQFKFPSNKLAYLLEALKIGEKVKTGGFDLWLGCMRGNRASWQTMMEYNIGDVVEMEKLYMKLRPWIKGHPNPAMYSADKECCPTCGGDKMQKRGFEVGRTYRYQRLKCMECGSWSRKVMSEGGKQKKYVLAA
jgi:hypothetical protein